jgi:hypothetical protein
VPREQAGALACVGLGYVLDDLKQVAIGIRLRDVNRDFHLHRFALQVFDRTEALHQKASEIAVM